MTGRLGDAQGSRQALVVWRRFPEALGLDLDCQSNRLSAYAPVERGDFANI
ncbi:MAG: hypothetical protein KGJ57_15955 [Sphingomonadales bacterium]|nr:hypothetical protein [Sphingomonadales bacterium]MDE2170897.1 hypothetical protein [Sphingomonadales bacterium]